MVAAAEGGLLDLVRDGVTGHLCPYGDQTASIAAIQKLLFDPVHHEQMSHAARLDAKQWNWAAATRQLEGYYRTILKRERELPRRIAEYGSPQASQKEICAALQISKATLRRHERLQAESTVR